VCLQVLRMAAKRAEDAQREREQAKRDAEASR